jgi:hypothetical protein
MTAAPVTTAQDAGVRAALLALRLELEATRTALDRLGDALASRCEDEVRSGA